jgi:hypothetical protein
MRATTDRESTATLPVSVNETYANSGAALATKGVTLPAIPPKILRVVESILTTEFKRLKNR